MATLDLLIGDTSPPSPGGSAAAEDPPAATGGEAPELAPELAAVAITAASTVVANERSASRAPARAVSPGWGDAEEELDEDALAVRRLSALHDESVAAQQKQEQDEVLFRAEVIKEADRRTYELLRQAEDNPNAKKEERLRRKIQSVGVASRLRPKHQPARAKRPNSGGVVRNVRDALMLEQEEALQAKWKAIQEASRIQREKYLAMKDRLGWEHMEAERFCIELCYELVRGACDLSEKKQAQAAVLQWGWRGLLCRRAYHSTWLVHPAPARFAPPTRVSLASAAFLRTALSHVGYLTQELARVPRARQRAARARTLRACAGAISDAWRRGKGGRRSGLRGWWLSERLHVLTGRAMMRTLLCLHLAWRPLLVRMQAVWRGKRQRKLYAVVSWLYAACPTPTPAPAATASAPPPAVPPPPRVPGIYARNCSCCASRIGTLRPATTRCTWAARGECSRRAGSVARSGSGGGSGWRRAYGASTLCGADSCRRAADRPPPRHRHHHHHHPTPPPSP